mmetsp:Transcript_31880/g.92160  ORF Transcript_31880/g.92160 Transcript_31880/m.92160 type:complete len:95 (+) Transcript_31880:1-285(+)
MMGHVAVLERLLLSFFFVQWQVLQIQCAIAPALPQVPWINYGQRERSDDCCSALSFFSGRSCSHGARSHRRGRKSPGYVIRHAALLRRLLLCVE